MGLIFIALQISKLQSDTKNKATELIVIGLHHQIKI